MALKLKCKPLRWTRISQLFSSTHKGIDLAAPKGTKIVAAADGTVYAADWSPLDKKNGSYGWQVVLKHSDGSYTTYAHCSKLCCEKGDKVKAGDKIAEVGSTGKSTGPHCHFEVRTKLSSDSRVNPKPYLDAIESSTKTAAKSSGEYNYKVNTSGSRLRVRAKASTGKDSAILTTLANGKKIHVDRFSGKMAHIDKPVKGYVSKTYIKKI